MILYALLNLPLHRLTSHFTRKAPILRVLRSETTRFQIIFPTRSEKGERERKKGGEKSADLTQLERFGLKGRGRRSLIKRLGDMPDGPRRARLSGDPRTYK